MVSSFMMGISSLTPLLTEICQYGGTKLLPLLPSGLTRGPMQQSPEHAAVGPRVKPEDDKLGDAPQDDQNHFHSASDTQPVV